MKRFFAAALIMIASVVLTGALAASETGSMQIGNLQAFSDMHFTAPANSAYGIYVFSADGRDVSADVCILENGAVVAEGTGRGNLCSAWLVSGTEYTIQVSGEGFAAVEIARQTLSRCADNPLPINEDDTKEKMIARAGDAHWYGFTSETSGMLMMTCVPQEAGLALTADLFDGDGNRIAPFEELPGGACMLQVLTGKDQSYAVRIEALNGSTGSYALTLQRAAEEIQQALHFDVDAVSVPLNGTGNLAKVLSGKALLWVSDDPFVACVDQKGMITGTGEGSTRVTAYGLSANVSCSVNVAYVPLKALAVVTDRISIAAGDEAELQLTTLPSNTSDRSFSYRSEDASIVEVSQNGIIKGISEGEAVVTVKSMDSGLECSVVVQVSPAARRYRALLVAEENYPHAEGSARRGSRASAEAIAALLTTMDYESAAFVSRTRSNLSRAELIAEIRSTFSGAAEKDLSLLYITCHGSYQGGMTFFELSDGSSLSARDLERELRSIPGTIVILLDCCASGGAIGASADDDALAAAAVGAFAESAFASSKYKVFCSAGLDQDSFRVAFNEDAESGVMATAFARALCDGGGWDIDRNARAAMQADADYDGCVSVVELQMYLKERVDWYLDLASSLIGARYQQSVQVYPVGDPMVLFKRKVK